MKIILVAPSEVKSIHFLNKIVKLDQEYFPWPWKLEQWEKQLENENTAISIAIENDKVFGFCLFSVSKIEKLGHLLKILIDPEFRGNGLAKLLHKAVTDSAMCQDVKSLYLEVSTKNLSAIRCYETLGYEILVLKKKYYSNGDDAFAMQKRIN